MLNPQIVEITLSGTIPSKKNSRANRGDGVSFPSKEFAQWQKDSLVEVRRQTRQRFFGFVQIEAILYFGNLGVADTDNKITSILDMLVEALVLPGDHWEKVVKTGYEAAYRKDKPGAFIRITPVDGDFFGPEYIIAAEKRDKRNHKPKLL